MYLKYEFKVINFYCLKNQKSFLYHSTPIHLKEYIGKLYLGYYNIQLNFNTVVTVLFIYIYIFTLRAAFRRLAGGACTMTLFHYAIIFANSPRKK